MINHKIRQLAEIPIFYEYLKFCFDIIFINNFLIILPYNQFYLIISFQ